jgi:hypothetical protein
MSPHLHLPSARVNCHASTHSLNPLYHSPTSSQTQLLGDYCFRHHHSSSPLDQDVHVPALRPLPGYLHQPPSSDSSNSPTSPTPTPPTPPPTMGRRGNNTVGPATMEANGYSKVPGAKHKGFDVYWYAYLPRHPLTPGTCNPASSASRTGSTARSQAQPTEGSRTRARFVSTSALSAASIEGGNAAPPGTPSASTGAGSVPSARWSRMLRRDSRRLPKLGAAGAVVHQVRLVETSPCRTSVAARARWRRHRLIRHPARLSPSTTTRQPSWLPSFLTLRTIPRLPLAPMTTNIHQEAKLSLPEPDHHS